MKELRLDYLGPIKEATLIAQEKLEENWYKKNILSIRTWRQNQYHAVIFLSTRMNSEQSFTQVMPLRLCIVSLERLQINESFFPMMMHLKKSILNLQIYPKK